MKFGLVINKILHDKYLSIKIMKKIRPGDQFQTYYKVFYQVKVSGQHLGSIYFGSP